MGQTIIQDIHRRSHHYEHWANVRRFSILLATMVEERFIRNPCLKLNVLFPPALEILDALMAVNSGSSAVGSYRSFGAGEDGHLCMPTWIAPGYGLSGGSRS